MVTLAPARLLPAAFLVGDIVAKASDALGQTGSVVGLQASVELEVRTRSALPPSPRPPSTVQRRGRRGSCLRCRARTVRVGLHTLTTSRRPGAHPPQALGGERLGVFPTQQLRHIRQFRAGMYVIYKSWVGRVEEARQSAAAPHPAAALAPTHAPRRPRRARARCPACCPALLVCQVADLVTVRFDDGSECRVRADDVDDEHPPKLKPKLPSSLIRDEARPPPPLLDRTPSYTSNLPKNGPRPFVRPTV